ncbi:unnamed protein product [Pleuronectes platessa]|uniref:Uncharacterized protein n=1 Tax=Pleuronectes platessa TaxID=8262 RepID=A0A9N7ZBJ2_PLEPL|nr:unnamed protein product [Pleuronectes platessa]
MGPPGSVPYPVQASLQLHDAERVPACGGHSPITSSVPAEHLRTEAGLSPGRSTYQWVACEAQIAHPGEM